MHICSLLWIAAHVISISRDQGQLPANRPVMVRRDVGACADDANEPECECLRCKFSSWDRCLQEFHGVAYHATVFSLFWSVIFIPTAQAVSAVNFPGVCFCASLWLL